MDARQQGHRIVEFQKQVERMVQGGAGFEAVEKVIDRTPLNTDQKAALWLYAWALQPAEFLRRETAQTLALVG